MIMAAEALLRKNPDPDVDQIKTALGGNLCRCTGYAKIIKSVQVAAAGGDHIVNKRATNAVVGRPVPLVMGSRR